jgi:hypothetical protein
MNRNETAKPMAARSEAHATAMMPDAEREAHVRFAEHLVESILIDRKAGREFAECLAAALRHRVERDRDVSRLISIMTCAAADREFAQ